MVFVVNKDAVFYKKNAFRQAKLVSDMNGYIDVSDTIRWEQNDEISNIVRTEHRPYYAAQ